MTMHSTRGAAPLSCATTAARVCIAFADPVYVRSESIIVDRDTCRIHAVLHESSHLLGHVSEGMADAFLQNREALLTAIRPDGTVFELLAPVQTH